METKITTLPQLSFAEAVKLNFARITDFKGRSLVALNCGGTI